MEGYSELLSEALRIEAEGKRGSAGTGIGIAALLEDDAAGGTAGLPTARQLCAEAAAIEGQQYRRSGPGGGGAIGAASVHGTDADSLAARAQGQVGDGEQAPAVSAPARANLQLNADVIRKDLRELLAALKARAPHAQQPMRRTDASLTHGGAAGAVLARLSIADQVSELESIIKGLNEHIFDAWHLKVVRLELAALKRKASGKMELEGPVALRDSLLEEALTLAQSA